MKLEPFEVVCGAVVLILGDISIGVRWILLPLES